MKILGVDPGSRLTGFGVVDVQGSRIVHVASGVIRLPASEHSERLGILFSKLAEVIRLHSPSVLAVEKVFFAKNAASALKLGQARGVILLCGEQHGLESAEYSPTQVKQALSGYGHAQKEQVQRMVTLLTGHREFETADVSDALALAITHSFFARTRPQAAARPIDPTREA